MNDVILEAGRIVGLPTAGEHGWRNPGPGELALLTAFSPVIG